MTESSPRTLTEMRELVQKGVRTIGEHFDAPDDDWMATFFVQNPDGIQIMALSDPLFATNISKDMLGMFLRERVAGAYRYALLLNTHGVRLDQYDPEERLLIQSRVRSGEIRVEQLPGTYEELVLTVGDAEEEQVWLSEITRTPEGLRTHGPWRNQSDEPDTSYSGRFVGLNEYLAARP